jgi:integrase
VEKPVEAGSGRPTTNMLLRDHLNHVHFRYQSNEVANIILAIRPLRQLPGPIPADEFGPRLLKLVRQQMIDQRLCRNEVNKRVRRVVRAFKRAVAEELIPAPVHHTLRTVEGLRRGRGVRETEPIKPVADPLVDAVKPFVSAQIWAVIELQRLTGMRPGEVWTMRSCDPVTSGRIWEYRPARYKTVHNGKTRVIFIGPQAQVELRPWLRPELEAYLFQPAEAETARRRAQRDWRKGESIALESGPPFRKSSLSARRSLHGRQQSPGNRLRLRPGISSH